MEQMNRGAVHGKQPSARCSHSSIVTGSRLYLWGGKSNVIPKVHANSEKLNLLSFVDVFDLKNGFWQELQTTGSPPLGVISHAACPGAAGVAYYFGGYCGHDNCYHNSLHRLSTEQLQWTELSPTNSEHGPMRKMQCGMAPFYDSDNEHLVIVGGYGVPPCHAEHAQYIEGLFDSSKGTTNEIHVFTPSSACWRTPKVIGEGPPPSNGFSFSLICDNGDKAVLYGGYCPASNSRESSVYVAQLSKEAVFWTKISSQKNPLLYWPSGKCDHAGVMFTVEGAHGVLSWLFVVGGIDDSRRCVNECWLLDLQTKLWHKVSAPDLFSRRMWHSVSAIALTRTCVLVIVFGGKPELSCDPNDDLLVLELEKVADNKWIAGVILNADSYSFTEDYRTLVSERLHGKDSKSEPANNVTRGVTSDEYLQQALAEMTQRLLQSEQRARAAEQEAQRLREERDDANKQVVNASDEMQQLRSQLDALMHTQNEGEQDQHWVVSRDEIVFTNDVLGSGSWGEVKVAIFRGVKVAAKFLHSIIISEYSIRQFSREMNIASMLHHPNLVQFIGATTKGEPIILTELMSTSLRKVLEIRPLSDPEILCIARDVACGLNYLHLRQPHAIIHRDVSSANILLDESTTTLWKAKLSDYGSANFVHKVSTVAPGNAVYAAPEAMVPMLHSTKMDVFSYGILLTEMCVRELPALLLPEREQQILSVKWPAMLVLIRKCTTQEAKRRPSIGELLVDLDSSVANSL